MSDLSTITQICSEEKGLRSQSSIQTLSSLLKPIKFFSSLLKSSGSSQFEEICQVLQYNFCPSSSFVFHFGDIGTRYYIILEGRVSMRIPGSDPSHLQEIMIYEKYSAFGEIALEAYKARGASAFCLTDCHFLCMDKKDYLKYMQRPLSETKKEIVSFLQNLPFFNKLSVILLKKLTYNIKELTFKKHHNVFKQGDEARFVFILRRGECQLNKLVYAELSPSRNLRSMKRMANAPARVVAEGSLLGEDAVLNNLPYNCSCAVISDNALLYQISAKEFLARVGTDELLKYLQSQSDNKKQQIDDWEKARANLDRVFTTPQKEIKKELDKVEDTVQKMRVRNCVSQRVIRTVDRPGQRGMLDQIEKEAKRCKGLPDLIRARSNPKASSGVSLVSMNQLPVLESLWKTSSPGRVNRIRHVKND